MDAEKNEVKLVMAFNIVDAVNDSYGAIKEKWVPFDRKKKIGRRDRKLLKFHPDWTPLTEAEKKFALYEEEYAQFTAFKNVYCRGEALAPGFVSDIVYQNIMLPKLHKMDYLMGRTLITKNLFNDKNYFEILMPEINFPEAVLRNVDGEFLTPDYKMCRNPLEILNKYEKLVFKGSLFHGHTMNVRLVEKKDYEEVLKKYYKEDYVVQIPSKQNDFFAQWNPSSVNIVRVTTLFWKGSIYVLGGILRVGPPGEFCDLAVSKDGEHPRVVGIMDDGSLMDRVVDPDTATVHSDIWGHKPGGKIEQFEEMKRLAVKAHERFPHHKISGWDFTVDDKGKVVCMEYNALVPGIIQSQYVLGPVFDKIKTSEGNSVLEDIINY